MTSRLPGVIGICADDVPGIAGYVNSAQRRLLTCKEAANDGWWGTWAEIVFNVSCTYPYITLPREIARLEWMNVCDRPVQIQNQFFEYLNFGNGRMPKSRCICPRPVTTAYTRNNAVTFRDLEYAPQYLTVYITDLRDIGKKVMPSGLDQDSNQIVSTDVDKQVNGEMLTLVSPSVRTTNQFSEIQGFQKDETYGLIRIYQHDPTTGDEVLLLTMQPGETVASYRRYYINGLPLGCCDTGTVDTNVSVTAIAKLDLIPVQTPTDYTLIQSLEAIIEECASIRYSTMDSPTAKSMSVERHKQAVGFLNGELNHYVGKDEVAVGFSPFGSAKLRRQKIGRLW